MSENEQPTTEELANELAATEGSEPTETAPVTAPDPAEPEAPAETSAADPPAPEPEKTIAPPVKAKADIFNVSVDADWFEIWKGKKITRPRSGYSEPLPA